MYSNRPHPPLMAAVLGLLAGCSGGEVTRFPADPVDLATALTPTATPLKPHPAAAELCGALRLSRNLGEDGVAPRLQALRRIGPAAAGPLVDLLQKGPAHTRLAAATLLGGPCAHPHALPHLCRALITGGRQTGTAAAYALGDQGRPEAAPLLLWAILPANRDLDPAVRTAAASSLVHLGLAQGVPFLLAILDAGLPGRENPYGLPVKDRWALEKEIALRALRRLAGGPKGYQPEGSWQEMGAGADRWRTWWRETGQKAFPAPGAALRKALQERAKAIDSHRKKWNKREAETAQGWLRAVR